jgi:ABC-type glycerol-3-phosphate transport system substrate-binding protein
VRNSIVLLCCLFVTTACDRIDRENTPVPTPPAPATALTLAVGEFDLAGYQALIELFEAQHPAISVRLVAVAEIVSSETTDAIAALAAAADVFPYAPDAQAGREHLLDLEPLLSIDPTFLTDDFLPGLLDDTDSLFSLPVAASYPLVFFDKAAFDSAGLAYPVPGWTLDEFVATAQALTVRGADGATRWGFVPFYVQPLLAVQLAKPLRADGGARFTDPDVAQALRWVADLFTTHQVSPWLDRDQAQDVVDGGRAAMWLGGHVRWSFMSDAAQVGVTAMPGSDAGYAIEPTRTAFAISRGTAHPEAAWRLLNFLSQQKLVGTGVDLLVPARRSVAAAADYWDHVPEPLTSPLQYAIDHNAGPRDAIALLQALASVVDGQPVADALAAQQAAETGQQAEAQATAEAAVVVATQETPSTITRIVFATAWNEAVAQRELAEAFAEEHREIRVTVRRIDLANDFYQEIAGADCFAASGALNRLAELVRPVDPILELDSTLRPADFYPGAIAALTRNGSLLGLPAWINVPLIQYNRALLAAAGVAEPPPDWTLAEFLEAAEALTSSAAGQYGYVDWSQAGTLAFGPAQFGVTLVDQREAVAAIDYAAAAPMVGWHVDLVARYGVHPALPGDLKVWSDYFDRSALFYELARTGKAAMWPHTAVDQELRQALAGSVETGFAPVPRGPTGFSFSLADRLTAYFIAAGSDAPQACWEWLEFLVTQPTATAFLPAHTPTAESAAFAEHVGADQATAMLASVAGDSGQPANPALSEPWLTPGLIWLTALTEHVAKGEIGVDAGLADAAGKFAQYRACVIDRGAFDNAAAWQRCAIQADPELDARY